MKKLDHWWYFMSPVSGQLAATEQLPQISTGYIWIGNLLGEPQASPAFIDMQLDVIELRHLIDALQITIPSINSTYLLQKNDPLLPNSQSLESLGQDGLLKTVNDSLAIAIPDEDYVDPETYREEVEKLEGEINELQEELQFLNSSFYTIKDTYDLLKAAILTLENNIINIEGWKKDIEEEISYLDTRIAEIEAILYEVLRQLRMLYLEIAAVVDQCKRYADQAQISAENSADSASDAKGYRDQAKDYRDDADDYADSARNSAISAGASAAEAEASELEADAAAAAAAISAGSALGVLATLLYYNEYYQNQGKSYAQDAQLASEDAALSANKAFLDSQTALTYSNNSRDAANDAQQALVSIIDAQTIITLLIAKAENAEINIQSLIQIAIDAASQADNYLISIRELSNIAVEAKYSASNDANLAQLAAKYISSKLYQVENLFLDSNINIDQAKIAAAIAEQSVVECNNYKNQTYLWAEKAKEAEYISLENAQLSQTYSLDSYNYSVIAENSLNDVLQAVNSIDNSSNKVKMIENNISTQINIIENLLIDANLNSNKAQQAADLAENSYELVFSSEKTVELLTEKARNYEINSAINSDRAANFAENSYDSSLVAEEFSNTAIQAMESVKNDSQNMGIIANNISNQLKISEISSLNTEISSNNAYLSQSSAQQDALLASESENKALVYAKNANISEGMCFTYATKTEDEYNKAEQAAIRAEIAESSIVNSKIILNGDVTGVGDFGSAILTSIDKSILYNFLNQNIRTGTVQIGNIGNFDLGDLETTGSILTATKSLGYTGTNDNIIEITYENLGYAPIPSIMWSDPTASSVCNDMNIISVQYIDNTTMKLYISSNSSSTKNGKLLITLNSSN